MMMYEQQIPLLIILDALFAQWKFALQIISFCVLQTGTRKIVLLFKFHLETSDNKGKNFKRRIKGEKLSFRICHICSLFMMTERKK